MDAGQKNYVSLLNEAAQKNGFSTTFVEVKSDGPAHNKTFTMRVEINGKPYPEGEGRNKKEAKQNAAKNALSCLEEEKPENTGTRSVSCDNSHILTQPNFICWLNEYSQKNKVAFRAVENTRMSLDSNILLLNTCKFVCNDREFPEAVCLGKKDAKEAAAKLVYEELIQKSEVFDGTGNGTHTSNVSSVSPDASHVRNCDSPIADNNFIGLLNTYCQKNKLSCDFNIVKRIGPSHNPEFVYVVVVSQKEYPEGRGKTAKEAKQNAARLAWSKIQGQSDSSSQATDASTVSSSPASMSLSADDGSFSESVSRNLSSDQSVVFASSSLAAEPKNVDVKPKNKFALAPNFMLSPVNNKERPSVKSPKVVNTDKNPSTKSRFLEEFESIVKVGGGGFGSVYRANRRLEEKNYAVKIVKFNSKARKEIAALADFNHENIVRYYTCWIEETKYRDDLSQSSSSSNSGSEPECNYLYIQMELCEGNTLRKWIEERNSKQDLNRRKEAAIIMRQVLEAVKYIHSKNRFHRDLKPANIMFGGEGGETVKVGDFGLVTEEEEDSDGDRMKRTVKTGTYSYMAPEQRVQRSYNRKVDIYALGLIYFELIWSVWSVTGHERSKIWSQIRERSFPEHFSERFSFEHKLIDQMLHKDPEKRPAARKLLSELVKSSAVLKTDVHVRKENVTY